MMNMMTGAVSINGGVGVMEIRQLMTENVAQAAEQVALNAHITLSELKAKIDTVVEKKLPTFKTLMEKKPVAVGEYPLLKKIFVCSPYRSTAREPDCAKNQPEANVQRAPKAYRILSTLVFLLLASYLLA